MLDAMLESSIPPAKPLQDRRPGSFAVAVAAAWLATGVLSVPAAARTWIVDPGCVPPIGCDCNEIQECIDQAAEGDTVLVRAGTYNAQATRSLTVDGSEIEFTAVVFLKDGVDVVGEGELGVFPPFRDPVAIIDGGGTAVGVIAHEVAAGPAFTNFLVQNGNAAGAGFNSVGGGMLCLGSDLTISDNIFEQNQAAGQGGALACEDDSSPAIDRNVFNQNSAGVDGGAIYCCGGQATITENIFEQNQAPEGAAIRYIAAGSITDNTFRSNMGSTGILADIALRGGPESGLALDVRGNLFHDNTSAIFMVPAPATSIEQNTIIRGTTGIDGTDTGDQIEIRNNIVVTNDSAGIVWSGEPPILACNDVWQNPANYQGLDDPTNQDGNISEDPLHCGPQENDFTVATNSPCAPDHSEGCGLIGARDTACPDSPVEPTSWGAIKAVFQR